ncbi:hypothetical protein [Nocardioides sp. CFH 31398]|uniref:hypothetical protein n=1 Tax=Nocardioides sp. CFH 31398 TaxID=2919579 RepID=UPI001F068833|nr:hypothetical protein [Nocardioides sp. CFH 31398]MCH1866214.1 hypothetical protein [Nocardioides sp. CFH 31398]
MTDHGPFGATLELRYQAALPSLVPLMAEVDSSTMLRGRLTSVSENRWSSLTVLVEPGHDVGESLAALTAFHAVAVDRLG